MRTRKWGIIGVVLVVMAVSAVWLDASGSWKYIVNRGLSVGDLLYADRTDRVTNLTAVAIDQHLGSAGVLTAPAYKDDTLRNSSTLAITATSQTTFSAVEARIYFWKLLSVSGSYPPVITLPTPTAGAYAYLVWNSSGQTATFKKSGGSGGTLASTKTGHVIYLTSDYIVKAID